MLALCGLTLLFSRAEAAPPPFTAEYRVFYGDTEIGTGTRNLEYDGARYRLTSTLQPAGLAKLFMGRIDEVAEGAVEEQRLRPEHYRFDRSDRPKKRRDFQLDWNQMQVKNASGDDFTLAPDALDTLSMQAQLMTDLQSSSGALQYAAVSRKGLKPYAFTVNPLTKIVVNGEAFETIHLVRTEADGERFEMWCAPSLNNLAVRIQHTEDDGKSFRLDLRNPPVFAQQTASN